MATAESGYSIPWWKEPTKDQWMTWVAAWLGWTLDAFDFTILLLIMVPIAQEFNVPLTEVTAVFTLTLWMRLAGAPAAGWLADRIGRKTPLMISIGWYSVCNFIAAFSPAFWFLFLFRALLGIGMGAEWPVGAALAMENWPIRSRAATGTVLQPSWGLAAVLSSAAYGLLYTSIGWRGLLATGVLPAFLIIYVRIFVNEPPVWLENRRLQRTQKREVRLPLLKIFKRNMLGNTLTACWMMASAFVVGYSIGGLFFVLSPAGPTPEPGAGGVADLIAEPGILPVGVAVGLVRRSHRSPLGDYTDLRPDHPGRAALSDDHRLHDDCHLLCLARFFRRRRHAHPIPTLLGRAVPNRGTGDGQRFRLSPGCDLGRPSRARPNLSRDQHASRLRNPDADRDLGRLRQPAPSDVDQPGDPRQGTGGRSRDRLIPPRALCQPKDDPANN